MISILPAFGKTFNKPIYERLCLSFWREVFFVRSTFVFVVTDLFSTLPLKLQNEIGKGAITHSRVYCLICIKFLIPNFHESLLAEQEKFGVRGNCLKLFQLVSKEWRQFVQFNDVVSDLLYRLLKTRQRSILRPLLFLNFFFLWTSYFNFLC